MAASIKVAKATLRKEVKQKIASLGDVEKFRQSRIVTKKLLNTDEYQKCNRISVFLSMYDEILTEDIVKHILESKRQCFIPKYVGTNMSMVQLKSWEDYQSLPETSWKIKQPGDDDIREEAAETGGLDLILMPGLAFTPVGHRLGRGKGYYDKYLTKLMQHQTKKPLTIALAFKEQIYNEIPTGDHDVELDMVLYEDR